MKNPSKNLIEYAEYIAPDGERYKFFGGNKFLLSMSGAGLPNIEFIEDKGPHQHGMTVRDFRYKPRGIKTEIFKSGRKRSDFTRSQARLINALRPNRSTSIEPGYFHVWLNDDTEMEIPVFLNSGIDGEWEVSSMNPADIMESVDLYCPDPFWRDAVSTDVNFSVDTIESCLDGSLCFPYCLGENTIQSSVTIPYSGTWDGDQIEITLTGPMATPVIENVSSGKTISLNYAINLGESVTISITPTRITVTNNFGANLIGTVNNLSDLTDFRILSESVQAPNGENVISVFASGGVSGDTGININYYTRHITLYGKD